MKKPSNNDLLDSAEALKTIAGICDDSEQTDRYHRVADWLRAEGGVAPNESESYGDDSGAAFLVDKQSHDGADPE